MAEQDPLDGASFLCRTMFERDPSKRKVKPVERNLQQMLDFEDMDNENDSQESNNDLENDSLGENQDTSDEEEQDIEEDDKDVQGNDENQVGFTRPSLSGNATHQSSLVKFDERYAEKLKALICIVCLHDVTLFPRLGSDNKQINEDEFVECDSCSVVVHEGCYGISDVDTVCSSDSISSTEPWFCDPCKAGNLSPTCELCPNTGGIFKETDVGKWAHIVCALYVPGVAFGDVDKLSPVTLFEMSYSLWGNKACFLCEDVRFSRTGVCIKCNAGMCETYFHVTCAQKEGLLSKATTVKESENPFFAYCKLHSDKNISHIKRQNYLAFKFQFQTKTFLDNSNLEEKTRIERKLAWHRDRYFADKINKPQPWVPTQKMPRSLTTSASACKALIKKAKLLGLSQELDLSSANYGMDVTCKWYVPPAFSGDFVNYYLNRNVYMVSMQLELNEQLTKNSQLQKQKLDLCHKYEKLVTEKEALQKENSELTQQGMQFWKVLSDFSNRKLPLPNVLQPNPTVKYGCSIYPNNVPMTVKDVPKKLLHKEELKENTERLQRTWSCKNPSDDPSEEKEIYALLAGGGSPSSSVSRKDQSLANIGRKNVKKRSTKRKLSPKSVKSIVEKKK